MPVTETTKRQLEAIYDLSPLQQGLLFHSVYAPEAGEYVVQLTCELVGELDAEAFERAWRALLDRHPILRSSFHWQELEKPVQVVHRSAALHVERIAGSPAWEGDGGEALRRFLREDRRRGFEPARAPLLRLALIRLGERRHRFVWSYHHLLLDGWSLTVLLRELFALYAAQRAGGEADLPAAYPYGDYIAWLGCRDRSAAEAFWRRSLAGVAAPPPLDLGREGCSPPLPGEARARVEVRPGRRLGERLERFARGYRLTPSTLLQGAWARLLSLYTRRPEVVFGIAVSGRPPELAGVETRVGLFLNTLPLRVPVASEARLVPWLEALRDQAFAVQGHADTPLQEIQRWSGLPAGTPLGESALAYENFPLDEALEGTVAGIEVRDVQLVESSHYPLALVVHPRPELALRALYDPGRYGAATVRRLLGHLVEILEGMLERPQGRVGELDLLRRAERHQLLVEWNDTARPLPEERTVVDLVAARARESPDRVALVAGERLLTYGCLERRAADLAARLAAGGVGRGGVVGVLAERSLEQVAAILAILQSGAAYLPIDPAYPPERIALLLEDSGVATVLTQERLRAAVPRGSWRVLSVDRAQPPQPAATASGKRAAVSRRRAGAAETAYVIYTSGSTGRPKGVELTHRGLLNLVLWHVGWYGMTASDRATCLAGLAFDASVWELWPSLASGGALHLADDDVRTDPRSLRRFLDEEGITVSYLPTPLVEAVLAEPWSPAPALRVLTTGGDRLHSGPPAAFPVPLVNNYGPSEGTVAATFSPVLPAGQASSPPPIGRPIGNTRVHLLDADLRPVPAGVAGELVVAGTGLARGYRGRPALTADRFRPDPFAVRPGERFYRTGDLARRRADGVVEFLGRLDHQVKVRGFRIEPGEIEAALASCPGVREAVVLARGERSGDRRLVAYVVPRELPGPPVAELREALLRRLPAYMVPAAFVELAALPLTENGKVDRRALPEPAPSRRDLDTAFVPPRSPSEVVLAEVWAEVLGVDQVGVEDDFFALGGDSILSLQVVSRAARRQLRVTPRQIFEHPTVAALAAVAESGARAAEGTVTPSGPLPLAPIQRWFFEAVTEVPHHWNQALLLAVPPRLEARVLGRALAVLRAHHEALRLRFPLAEGGRVAEVRPAAACGGPVEVVERDLEEVDLAERGAALEATAAELQGSLDLERGPLFAAALFRFGARIPGRLFLVFHHLVVDGVSWRILLEDLEQAVTRLGAGEEPDLPPVGTPWGEWTHRLQAFAREGLDPEEVAWWLESPAAALPPLPEDGPGGANDEASVEVARGALSPEATRALLRAVPAASQARVEELLLAALAGTLAAWSGGGRLAFDLEGHGREEVAPGVDLSRTVGWFTALYPLSLEVPADGGPRELLAAVKEALRRVPRRGLGYGVLRYLGGDAAVAERLAGQPRAAISFNYLGQFDGLLARSSLFSPAAEPTGPMHAPRERRWHLLEWVTSVVEGRLEVACRFSVHRHRRATAERLVAGFLERLEGILDHWSDGRAAPCRVPAEFPLARIGRGELERLEAAVGGIEDLYPLAPLQEGILFQSLYAPGSALYVEQLSCALAGEMDVAAFAEAWRQVVARHPILRTAFVREGLERPLQAVLPAVELEVACEDWRSLPPEEQRSRFADRIDEDRHRPFDLVRPPLLRLRLCRVEEEVSLFAWTFHHLLLDGWSGSIVLSEVFELYGARRAGRAPTLAPVPPFREHVAWVERQDRGAAEEHWRGLLDGFRQRTPLTSLAPLEMARVRPRSPGRGEERGYREATLPRKTTGALTSFARQHRLTPNTLVQGAWALVLGRSAGVPEVVFGTTVSGRPPELPAVERMVGLFINTLPVRVALPPRAAVVPWLEELQRQQVESRQHGYTPLASVQAWSDMAPGEALFDSLLVFESYPVEESLRRQEGSLRVSEVRFVERADLPLAVVSFPGEELWLRVAFDRRRFDGASIERLLRQLGVLLESFAARPGSVLAELSLLTAAERHQVLSEWNAPAGAAPPIAVLPQLFGRWAESTPDAVALTAGEVSLTYGALARRAGEVAQRLRQRGAGPEEVVGVACERGLEMVVAMLGVLLAGGAYLPLDPTQPQERLAFCLRDSGARLLLTGEGLEEALPQVPGVERIGVAGPAPRPVGPLPVPPPEALAYLIYTSGSTGAPKAVAVSHRALANRLLYARDHDLGPRARYLQKTSVSFDVSVLEIFAPLAAGGTSVLARPGGERDGSYLVRLMAEQEVTHTSFPPALLQALLDEPGIGDCRALVSVVSGGEAMNAALEEAFSARLGAELLNRYGPTETTIAVTSYRCPPGATEDPVPIGRPIAGAEAYVLGRELEPLAAGTEGELFLGGTCLARGYLGQPGLTAERFVPHPLGRTPGARLYRTGDRVRHRADGNLEFLGRLDEQVKIRGYRVELGEIERRLAAHPALREAAVVDRDDLGGATRLVAYLVPAEGPMPEAAELERFARRWLPSYMVPAAWVSLEELPRTASGKLDRRALPKPAPAAPRPSASAPAPASAAERVLVGIWKEVLGLPEVGVEENFFALGGDSILSLRVVAKAAQEGLALDLRQLFEHPTIAELAAAAEGRAGVEAEQGPVTGPVPLTPIQHRFFALSSGRLDHFNQAVLLALRRPLATEVLRQAIGRLLVHHDALRLRFEHREEGWRQSMEPPAPGVPLLRVDLGTLADEARGEAAARILAQAQEGFCLAEGRLVQAVLLGDGDGGGEGDRLFLVVHHLAVDGFSWRVLLEDLETACRAAQAGRPLRLPPKTTSYRRWARVLAEHAAAGGARGDLPYWLSGERAAVRPLPVDGPGAREANTVASVETVEVSLEAEETRSLLHEVLETYRARIDEVLLSALLRAFVAWTGSPSLLVDLESHGREHGFEDVDVSRTVGWFTSLYPVLLEAGPASSAAATLRAVRGQLRRVPRGGLSYGLLRYLDAGEGSGERLPALPQAEVGFNYLGQLDGVLEGSSLFAPAAEPSGAARDPAGRRRYLLDVNGAVRGGRLTVHWSYSRRLHRRATVERLARGFADGLRELLEPRRAAGDGAYSPEDFPHAGLDSRQLEKVLRKVGRGGSRERA